MTSRTEELRQQGHTEPVSNSESEYENVGFIRWGDTYNFVEGIIESFFDSKYGDPGNNECVTLLVTKINDEAVTPLVTQYKEDPPQPVKVGQKVNIGLNNAALRGKILPEKVGHEFHIAFEKWGKSTSSGFKYRIFTQFDLGKPENKSELETPETESSVVKEVAEALDAEVVKKDDDLPF
tara:strand:+ start:594 stop:1133 length:540 start_codon:yes stop_codon:yes gene_type:complete